jgi:hypothetical protein
VFLHRSLAGLHQILKVLKARADWGAEFEASARACRADAERQARVLEASKNA